MLYKTICLELLRQQPELHEQLRRNRTLLPTMERLARELKTRHEVWMTRLAKARPGSSRSQIAGEALEMALHDPASSTASLPPDENQPPPDEARRPTSPA